ncbi:MAG: hypothetical protein ABI543_00105 [Ignavibacteria bacterium]
MIKHVIKILLAFYCFHTMSLAQDLRHIESVNQPGVNNNDTKAPLQKDFNSQKSTIQNETISTPGNELYRYSFDLMQTSRKLKEESTFNIVSSFRQNIRFGGFWDRYAIVNFTPDMYIKPFDFMSIYAVHNSSYFIPIKAVKDHFKLMAIQSAAILAIDNTVKFFLPMSRMLKAIAGFVLKNIVINGLMKDILSRGSDKIFEQGNYYCAVSIRF